MLSVETTISAYAFQGEEIMEFCGICIITENVPRLATFYQNILHATAVGNDVHVEIATDMNSLAIYSKSAAINDMKFDLSSCWGIGNITLMFRVDDVDAEYERIKAYVSEFMTSPTTYLWGTRAFHFRDPDGNIVDFFSRIAT
ncbi:glyoxalase/bleomycin resistance protein/dioxygenase [Candidatus Moduliflexus flocculans]|uniref:Glyoxalase/bleomycin resistance protein/dioxygenase n=1 Tax=Candidatus Moduliflexus flocculans TaxID=1499966 RepID=A0A081BSN5_9BACT|nr:glyoxalase/bleomycin resistance protein/dioxygenase [Candidatus Moduliflexus flocculans]